MDASYKPHDRLAELLSGEMAAVNTLIAERMSSEHAPRIPEVTAHLVNAGGKRLRPMLTLASALMCGYDGPYHIHLAATVEFIHTATLLHDDVAILLVVELHSPPRESTGAISCAFVIRLFRCRKTE